MAGALNLTAAQEALKLFYLPGLQYQLNTANPILSVIEKDSQSVQGSQIVMALRYGRAGGVGVRADDGTLPTPNSRKTKQAKWDTKNIFARIQVSDKTMRSSRSNQGAFVSLLEADLEDALADSKDQMARMVYGDGTGKAATCSAGTTVTTITVDTVQYLFEGQLIDILDNTNAVKYAEREITAVDDVNKTITISGTAVTVLATDYITMAGNYNMELTGLGKVFTANNTLYGIDRSVNKWFNPTTIPVNGEISEVWLQKGLDDTDRAAGGTPDFFATSYGVRRAYQNLLLATKQIVQPMELEGGYSVLTYNGKPFTADKYAPASTIFGMDMSTWRLYQVMDWDWLDDDGAVLSRVSNKPIWEATLARYCDLGCSKPKGNYKMTGITEH
jgi:hypothetical protein